VIPGALIESDPLHSRAVSHTAQRISIVSSIRARACREVNHGSAGCGRAHGTVELARRTPRPDRSPTTTATSGPYSQRRADGCISVSLARLDWLHMSDQFLTVDEIAESLKVNQQTVRNWI
jgi:hypothetical protein